MIGRQPGLIDASRGLCPVTHDASIPLLQRGCAKRVRPLAFSIQRHLIPTGCGHRRPGSLADYQISTGQESAWP